MKGLARSSPVASPRFQVTAACPSGKLLSIVTLNWTGKRVTLVRSACTIVELISDDQSGVQAMAKHLYDFLERQGIGQIVIRRLSAGGPKSGSTAGTKYETMLQLMPLKCYHVTTQRIGPWVRSQDWLLPLPQKSLPASYQQLQMRAIETGSFAIHHVLFQTSQGASGASHVISDR